MTELASLSDDPSVLERSADPAQYVMLACERAKTWLVHALDHGDIEQIVELKSQAEAVRIYTMQKQLGKDAELSAAEIVRRAERGLGLAIRKQQEEGCMLRTGETQRRPSRHPAVVGEQDGRKPSPKDFLGGSHETVDVYSLTDDVSDEQFTAALDDARAEENLTRANVIRKVRGIKNGETPADRRRKIAELAEQGWTSRQIGKQVGIGDDRVRLVAREHGIDIPADRLVGKTRRIDAERIIRETVNSLEGLCLGVELLEPEHFEQLDPGEARRWSESLARSGRIINQLRKELEHVQD